MAAVAGSKGRIASIGEPSAKPSDQAALAQSLLNKQESARGAVATLLGRRRLREIGVDTNMVCNLSCDYCYLGDRREQKGRLSARDVSDYLVDCYEAGTRLFAFIGKEPLADGRALTIMNQLNEKLAGEKYRIGMVTNGTLVRRRLDAIIKADLSYLDISLDGFEDINDQLRGKGAYKKARDGVDAVLQSQYEGEFAITSVLSARSIASYPDFVDSLLDAGVQTCFGSPVLDFAATKAGCTSNVRLDVPAVRNLIEALAVRFGDRTCKQNQILIDLPYRYSWAFIAQNFVDAKEIYQDEYEAHYWHPEPWSPVIVKMNFFPLSYWRAARLTHDGQVLEEMDLAAHRLYSRASAPMTDRGAQWFFGSDSDFGFKSLLNFLHQIQNFLSRGGIAADRAVDKQFSFAAQSGTRILSRASAA